MTDKAFGNTAGEQPAKRPEITGRAFRLPRLPKAVDPVPGIEPWTPGPVLGPVIETAKREPELVAAAVAFGIALLFPRKERVCLEFIGACCRAMTKKEPEAKP